MKNIIISILILVLSSCGLNNNSFSPPDADSPRRTVYIKGLNNFEQEYIAKAKKIIEDNFNFKCVIQSPVSLNYSEAIFNCNQAQIELGYNTYKSYDYSDDVNLFITTENLHLIEHKVRGLCYGNQVYIEQYNGFDATLIHEMNHTIGLGHCKNECLMNSQARVRWDVKTNKPIYCKSCESKLQEVDY